MHTLHSNVNNSSATEGWLRELQHLEQKPRRGMHELSARPIPKSSSA